MKRVAILGLGLMGGSLGLALKRQGFSGTVAAYARRDATRQAALAQGVADEVLASPEEAVAGADLVILCVPILSMHALLSSCAGALKPGCVVTDVGSTKQNLADTLPSVLRGTSATFIGSHPLAGSERRGIEAGRTDLYDGAVVVVTPTEDDDPDQVRALETFWRGLQATVQTMAPATHDRILARTSHLPHLVAALLAATVSREGDGPSVAPYCGTGFRDTTRVADGSPEVWRDITESNRASLIDELTALREQVDHVLGLMRDGDFERLRAFLANCRDARRALLSTAGDAEDGDER